jgi:uncharacterized membrane protein
MASPVDLASGHTRLLATAGLGALAGLVVGFLIRAEYGVLVGMVTFALTFVAWSLSVLWPMDGDATRAHVMREDAGPVAIEAVIAAVAIGNLAVISSVALIGHGHGRQRDLVAAVALAAVFCSWAMLHIMYAARYARAYYDHPPGGIDFNTEAAPCYRDFVYFSFNLGMTYQVSDNDVSTTQLRSMIWRHCLMSYVFGTVILAATINLVASIALS